MHARSMVAALSCLLSLNAIAAINAAQFKDEHVAVELLSEHASLQPGTRAWIGLKLTHEPHWHTYWMNPGDSGLPTRFEWQLPNGFRAGDIAWPAPQRFELGGLFNFGYEKAVLLPAPIDIPASARPGTAVPISLNARWVVCNDDLCIPGKASLRIELPIAINYPTAVAQNRALFADARTRQPVDAKWQGHATVTGDRVRVELLGNDLPAAAGLDAFPTAPKLLNNTPFKISRSGNALVIEGRKNDYFEAAPQTLGLVLTQKDKNWRVAIPWKESNSSPTGAVK